MVNSSSFAFATNLPSSSRNIHPSGVLHARRTTPSASGLPGREEHAFAWIADSIRVEEALNHLENSGFVATATTATTTTAMTMTMTSTTAFRSFRTRPRIIG